MDSQGTGALAGYSRPWSPWSAIQSRLVRVVLGFCVFELTYICAYYFGMSFDPVVAAPFWFPDAVLLCGLLSTRRKWWWLLLVAILPELHEINGAYRFTREHQKIKDVLAAGRIPTIERIEALRGHGPESSLWVKPADPHPNGKANALIAARIAPWILENVDSAR